MVIRFRMVIDMVSIWLLDSEWSLIWSVYGHYMVIRFRMVIDVVSIWSLESEWSLIWSLYGY